MGRREKRTRVCPICGTRFEVTVHNRRYCSAECYREHVRRDAREYARRKRRERAARSGLYVVVSDPLPPEDGGFSPGASFSWNELHAMLINRSVVPGTVLRHATRKREYTVREHAGRLVLSEVSQ